jgi:hypothetical protein
MQFFLYRQLKKGVNSVPLGVIEELVARFQKAITKDDAIMLWSVRGNSVQRTALCLKMDGVRFEHLL